MGLNVGLLGGQIGADLRERFVGDLEDDGEKLVGGREMLVLNQAYRISSFVAYCSFC